MDGPSRVLLKPGIWADASGSVDSADALQASIDATGPHGMLELPPGIYSIGKPLVITKPMTLTTRGLADSVAPIFGPPEEVIAPGRYATLKASPALAFGFHRPSRDQDKGLLCVRPAADQEIL